MTTWGKLIHATNKIISLRVEQNQMHTKQTTCASELKKLFKKIRNFRKPILATDKPLHHWKPSQRLQWRSHSFSTTSFWIWVSFVFLFLNFILQLLEKKLHTTTKKNYILSHVIHILRPTHPFLPLILIFCCSFSFISFSFCVWGWLHFPFFPLFL